MRPLPGKPVPGLLALSQGLWAGRRIITYITGNAFVILTGPHTILQTIYDGSEEGLQAITFDETCGKIAVCTGSNVRVYKPYGLADNSLKWSLQHSFHLGEAAAASGSIILPTTLSWGSTGELLVGNACLALFATTDTLTTVWEKLLPNPAKVADFSYNSAYIASTGNYDRLVKIWRRLSFGSDDTRFDFSYLPHPSTVTAVHWKKPYHIEHTIDNLLYTFCNDNILRIWAPSDIHETQHLQLCGKIDLGESIQPRAGISSEITTIRYAFMIDGRDFMSATEHAVQSNEAGKESDSHALSHLIEVANRSPDVCVVLDDSGRMSAWGLESIGSKPRVTANIFNIAHVDGLNWGLSSNALGSSDYIRCYNYCNNSDGKLNILVHHFNGSISFLESNIANLFDPSPRNNRLVSKANWTGHSTSISKTFRDVSGHALVSRTDGNEAIVWKHIDNGRQKSIVRQSLIGQHEHISRICVIKGGKFVFFLHDARVTLWDAQKLQGSLLASCDYVATGEPLCLLVLPGITGEASIAHVALITSRLKGIVWEVRLPPNSILEESNALQVPRMREFCRFDLGDADNISDVLPVDPAGSPPAISGFLDTFAKDIAISYTHHGLLRSWTTRLDLTGNKVDWLQTCSVDTGTCEPALVSGSSTRKAAVVDSNRSELTIWDVRGARLEFAETYEARDNIQDLDWTSTPDDQSILAVGFRFRVILLAQLRYDYLNKGPAWAVISELSIHDYTPHPIGDSTWLSGGNLVVGSGNQLYVFDTSVDSSASLTKDLGLSPNKTGHDLFGVVTRLNGPLPFYHPQFLGQCTLASKSTLVQRVIVRLHQALKYFVEGDTLDTLLGIDLQEFYLDTQAPSYIAATDSTRITSDLSDVEDEAGTVVTESIAAELTETLSKIALPNISRQEQIQLADIVECVAIVEKQRRSMDDNAAKFMLLFRQHVLRRGRANEVLLSWREINWAYHSNSQDILVDMVTNQFHGKILWEHARESGMFMWMTDSSALKAQFEIVARNEYTKTDLKNPIDCSLFYLALRKKTVLQGLWRMAAWNREQSATIKLLANNFSDKKWKTAAMKNAYALLGKRRYEYAAAFFLLADSLKDAVSVILKQLKDLQLAITITRVYEGDSGSVLRELLEEEVLPLASREGNRWLASWTFWMLRRRDMAVRALVSPVYTLLESSQSPDIQAKMFLTDDPALVALYAQLRQTTLQTLRGASKIAPKAEWDFVLHNAHLYDRMGCDVLALDLVRNWEFIPPDPTVAKHLDDTDPRFKLRRRSSLVVADLPVSMYPMDMKAGNHRPTPTVFEEPESSSLLDNFGF